MSYSISYDKQNNKKYKTTKNKTVNYRLIFKIALVVVLLVLCLIKPTRIAIVEFLLPGNGAVTRKAAQEMFCDLKQGQGVKEAFTAFCTEILQNE